MHGWIDCANFKCQPLSPQFATGAWDHGWEEWFNTETQIPTCISGCCLLALLDVLYRFKLIITLSVQYVFERCVDMYDLASDAICLTRWHLQYINPSLGGMVCHCNVSSRWCKHLFVKLNCSLFVCLFVSQCIPCAKGPFCLWKIQWTLWKAQQKEGIQWRFMGDPEQSTCLLQCSTCSKFSWY